MYYVNLIIQCLSLTLGGVSYSRINSIKSPASGASREYARSRVRVAQNVRAVRAVDVPVFCRLRSSCNHVTEVGGT
jgi:hypothetical protein